MKSKFWDEIDEEIVKQKIIDKLYEEICSKNIFEKENDDGTVEKIDFETIPGKIKYSKRNKIGDFWFYSNGNEDPIDKEIRLMEEINQRKAMENETSQEFPCNFDPRTIDADELWNKIKTLITFS